MEIEPETIGFIFGILSLAVSGIDLLAVPIPYIRPINFRGYSPKYGLHNGTNVPPFWDPGMTIDFTVLRSPILSGYRV